MLILINKGDREAFNEIYQRYWLNLLQIAVRKVSVQEEAEDIIQDLFVSIWIKRHSLHIHTTLKAYLFSALKYKIINLYESKCVRKNYSSYVSANCKRHDNTTEEMVVYNEVQREFEIGLEKLSPKVKHVFLLSRNDNLSISEIAERLDISQQTVKNQISKALRMLKAHLIHGYIISAFIFTLVYN
ncbi:RNA polymerase sigma-70 factor [Lunatibacter salilacus]|uniref:RNA polymerase sigma-70 factor n=1 Tax=Lunatibacter salilacus TaxID=2483804 RepID=UPI00131DF42F|nr:RNA polymerase sigma-70 factor [Lunatibacter salilacus]